MFVTTEDNHEQMLVSGSEGSNAVFRMINAKEEVTSNIVCKDARRFTQICKLTSFFNGVQTLIVGTDTGGIKIYGLPPYLHEACIFDSFNAH